MTDSPRRDRPRILLICFAYSPGAGSEPGIGYDVANSLARRFDVTVVTDRAWPGTPRDPDEAEGRPRIVRLDSPSWPAYLDPRRSPRRWQLYYYTWTRMLERRLPDIVRSVDADLVQHVTYERYWMPSATDTAGRPFIWGPVGGGESAPGELLRTSPASVRLREYFRMTVRAIFERDPALARTGCAASVALATTPESAARMRRLTDAPVEVHPGVCLSSDDLARLSAVPPPPDGPFRFLSLGRLLFWKGFDMGLEALAAMRHSGATLWIIGDGPERGRLERRAAELGLDDRVEFLGRLDRAATLGRIGDGHALLHPSLHDSGGMVCLEAMAARRPVVCLEGNGPALLCGGHALTAPMARRDLTVRALTDAMDRLAGDPALARSVGERSHEHVSSTYEVERRTDLLVGFYERVWRDAPARARDAFAHRQGSMPSAGRAGVRTGRGMRILFVHAYYQQPGGEDRAVETEAARMEARGHPVAWHTFRNDELNDWSLPRIGAALFWNGRAYRELRRAISRFRPDVVHVQNTFPTLSPSVYWAAAAERVPVVQKLSNWRLFCVNGLLYRDGAVCEKCLGGPVAWHGAVHGCFRGSRFKSAGIAASYATHRLAGTWDHRVAAWIALDEDGRDRFVAAGLDPRRVHVKPEAVDIPAEPGTGAGGFALFAGRLSGEKGVAPLLEAWLRHDPGIPLHIAGDGPDADLVRAATRETDRVRWLGRLEHDDLMQRMGDAAVVVVPSRGYETFGRTAAEAMAYGTPVAAARIGALRNVVRDGVSGRHFTPDDPADLARAVRSIVEDPDPAALRARAHAYARERFSPDAEYERLLAIYDAARSG